MDSEFDNYDAIQWKNSKRYQGEIVTERGTTILAVSVYWYSQQVSVKLAGRKRRTYTDGEEARQALQEAGDFLCILQGADPEFIRKAGLEVVEKAVDLVHWDKK